MTLDELCVVINLGFVTGGLLIAVRRDTGVTSNPAFLNRSTGGESMLEQAEVKNRPRVDIPIWMFGGEMEDWLLDAVPTAGNRTGKTIRTWWELNCMPGEIPENFGKSKKVMGRWNDWTYEKEGIPMVKFTGIDYYPHATNPEMPYRIWEEFFSKFRRGEDGAVIYEGQ